MAYRTDGSSALAPDDDYEYGGAHEGDSGLDDKWTQDATGSQDAVSGGRNNVINLDEYRRKNEQRKFAAAKAKKGEDGAVKGGSDLSGKNGNGISAAKNAESSTEEKGGFSNKVTGKAAEKAVPGGKFVVKNLKKLGPFGTILIVVCAIMGVFTASQSMAPFGLINNLMENYNSLKTSMNVRSKSSMMTRLIKGGKNTSIVKTSLFGKKNFKLSTKTQNKLANSGIFYDKNSRTLWFTDPDSGKTYGIAADEDSVSTIPDSVDITDKDGVVHHFEADADGGKTTYTDIMDVNDNFFNGNERSTRTLKGSIAGWFDSVSKKFHERIGNSRNRQANTAKGASDLEIENNARPENSGGMSEEAVDNRDTSVDASTDEDHPSSNPSRDVDTGDGIDTSGQSGELKKGMTQGEVEVSLSARAKSVAAALGTASSVVGAMSYACVAIKVVNSLIQTIQALSKSQVLNFGTGMFESIQKAETGDSSTELHFYMNKATTPDTDGTTMFGSTAIAQAFSDGKVLVSTDDPYVQKVSTVHISNQILDGTGGFTGGVLDGIQAFGSSLAAYKGCVQLQAVSGVLGIAADVASIAAGIMSGGITALIQTLLRGILKAFALSVIMSGIISIITGTLVPYVAKLLVRDLIGKDTVGAILGYASDSSANMYMGEQMQSATGLPGTEQSIMAQYEETQKVIADQARYERNTKSPFDVTSKYTFLGSIVNSITPLAMTITSPANVITSVPNVISKTTSLVGDSIASLLPTAQAMGVTNFKTSLSHDCGSLSNVIDPESGEELVCDAYGNPYFITRLDTMTNDAADVMDDVSTYKNRGTIYHYVYDPVIGWHDVAINNVLLEETNFEKGYYGDWTNFPGEIESMKKAGYYYRDSNYDGSFDMFYTNSNGLYQILRKESGDDGETAEVINPEIREHSELANYVVSCEIRETGYGQEDSQISGYVNYQSSSQSMGTLVSSLVGSIPIIGNLIQLRDTSIEANNVEWVSGENCLKPAFKLYSRYSEDQKLLEASEVISGDSAIASFLDKYYEENPIDYSTEGIIARYSGMSKDDVDFVLGFVEYRTFVANYNPEGRGPNAPVEEPEEPFHYDSETIIAVVMPDVIIGRHIIYDDLRTKSFAS